MMRRQRSLDTSSSAVAIPPCSSANQKHRSIRPWSRRALVRQVGTPLLLLGGYSVSSLVEAMVLQRESPTTPTNPSPVFRDRSLCPRRAPWRTTRSVSIRSVDWCGSNGMLPLQIYHAHAIEYSPGHRFRDVSEVDPVSLSTSSRAQLGHYETFSTYEQSRLLQKIQAEARAQQPLSPQQHLHVIYQDAAICVVHKPSGVLSVPGPRRNPSLANLIHDTFHIPSHVDKMVVHRLDMDTSGVVIYALNEPALSTLHDDFRQRRVLKTYEALVCGHVRAMEGEIHLPLERDPNRPPFMRVSMKNTTSDSNTIVAAKTPAHIKFLNQAPKPSETHFRVTSYEYMEDGSPVTRLELVPHTGRTHQLRVHCAAIGHPIVGDDIYGINGEGSPYGGLGEALCRSLFGNVASPRIQDEILRLDRKLCLHARQLCIRHPMSSAPMIFQADADF